MKTELEQLEEIIGRANERLTHLKIELKYREVILEDRELHIALKVNNRTVIYKNFLIQEKSIEPALEHACRNIKMELFMSGIIQSYNTASQIDENRKYYSDGEGY